MSFFQFMISWVLSKKKSYTSLISLVLSSSNDLFSFFMHINMQMLLERQMLPEQEENKNPSTRYLPWLGYEINATKALICFLSYNTTVAGIGCTGGCRYG